MGVILLGNENSLNCTKIISLKDLNNSLYEGQHVSFRGLVKAIGQKYPEYKKIEFECNSCMKVYEMEQKVTIGNRIENKPSKCEDCGGKFFNTNNDNSNFVDVQVIEIADINELRNGEIYTTTALLSRNLIDKVTWGDLVELKGIVESNKYLGRYFNFVNVDTIDKLPKSKSNIEIDLNDEKIIKKLSKLPNIFDLLVKSFSSTVKDHREIKEAIILQLFSIGSESEFKSENYLGSPNILLISENGLISEILKFTARVSPTGIILNGMKPLSIIPKIESKFGRHIVDAGTLILSDESILSINKINSISYGKEDIKIAMESQAISVKIGGCPISTLPAKTTILAGLNQKRKLNQNSPVSNQISMKSDLFFEFDLIFSLNEENLYNTYDNETVIYDKNNKLENIKLDESLIRKYISYANEFNPHITDESFKYLSSFFLDLRKNFGSYLINQKKFNAVIELAKASARIHLRDEITMEDSERAIKIYKKSLKSIGIDLGIDHPNIRMIMSRTEINKNKKLLRKIFKDIVKNRKELSFNRIVEVMNNESNLQEGLIRSLVADEYNQIK